MRTAGLGFLAALSLGIDLLRQRHMRYKAKQIVIIRKCIKTCGLDPRSLGVRDRLAVFTHLGVNLFVSDKF